MNFGLGGMGGGLGLLAMNGCLLSAAEFRFVPIVFDRATEEAPFGLVSAEGGISENFLSKSL